MKWNITALSLILTLAIVAHPIMGAATNCVVPSTNMVSWWTGDTNENDLYRVNNPSKVNAVSIFPAEVSNGFLFGTGAYIDIPFSSSLANQKFTMAAWVRPDGPGPNDDQFGSTITGQDFDDYHAVKLLWRATDDRFLFLFGNISSEIITSSHTFPVGNFYFVTATYDGTTFRLFVNGILEGSFAEQKKITYSSFDWEIGSTAAALRNIGYPRTWNGVVDEVQVYRVAVPASAIAAIYKAGRTGECKTPVVVTPTTETFAPQTVGTTSPAKTVTILNNRDAAITMDPFIFTGPDFNDFAGSTTCGSSLAARKTCEVSVTFTPEATGKRTATLNVNDTATGSPQRVPLTGTGN